MNFIAHEKKELEAKPSNRLSVTEVPVSESTRAWVLDGNSQTFTSFYM